MKAYKKANPDTIDTLKGTMEASGYAFFNRRHREKQLMRAYQNRVNRINAAPTRNGAVNATAKAIGGQG